MATMREDTPRGRPGNDRSICKCKIGGGEGKDDGEQPGSHCDVWKLGKCRRILRSRKWHVICHHLEYRFSALRGFVLALWDAAHVEVCHFSFISIFYSSLLDTSNKASRLSSPDIDLTRS